MTAPRDDEDDMLAAEMALGLLDRAHATAAEARAATDPALRARVDWWHERLSFLASDSVPPSAGLWHRIAVALPANDTFVRRLQRQPVAAGLAVALVVISVAALTWRPSLPPVAPASVAQPGPVMLASLAGAGGAGAAIAYQPGNGQLRIVPTAIVAAGHSAELWIIPADGRPRSLGVVDAGSPSARIVAADRRGWIAGGASFAISIEAVGGSPTGSPMGPVVAAGKIFAG